MYTVLPAFGIEIGPKLSSFQLNFRLFGKKLSLYDILLLIFLVILSKIFSFLILLASLKVKLTCFFLSIISLISI